MSWLKRFWGWLKPKEYTSPWAFQCHGCLQIERTPEVSIETMKALRDNFFERHAQCLPKGSK